MMTSFLRPLTLTAVATLVMIAPLAGTGPSPAALHSGTGTSLASRTSSVSRTALPVTGLPTGPRPKIAYAFATRPAFLGGNFRVHRPSGKVNRIGFLALGQWSTTAARAEGLRAVPHARRAGHLTRPLDRELARQPPPPARPGGTRYPRVHASPCPEG